MGSLYFYNTTSFAEDPLLCAVGLSEEPILHVCFFLPCVVNEFCHYSIFSIIGVQTRLISSVSLQLHKSNLAAIMVVPGPLVVP